MKKLNTKLSLLTVSMVSLFALNACNSGVGSSGHNPANATQSANNKVKANEAIDKDVLLGQGLLSSTYVVTSASVIEPVNPSSEPRIIGDQIASMVSFSKTIDKSITANDLGINGSINGKISDYTGSLAGEYTKATKDSETSISTDYAAIAAGQYSYASPTKDFMLPSTGKNLFEKDKDEFYRQFGDSFVSSVRAGVAVFANLKFVFQDSTTKSKIAANVNFSGDPVTIAGDILKNDSKDASKVKIEVRIAQFGGDVEKANSVFATGGASPTGENQDIYLFECSLTNFDACNNFLKNVNNYISGSGAGQLPAQISQYLVTGQNLTADKISKLYRFGPAASNVNSLGETIGSGAVIQYKFTPYSLLAAQSEVNVEPFVFSDDVIKKQQLIAKYYGTSTNSQVFLNSYYDLLSTSIANSDTLSKEMKKTINNYQDFVNSNFNKDASVMSDCYTPSTQASARCEKSFPSFEKTYDTFKTDISKYNTAYVTTNISEQNSFYLLPADDLSKPNEFVAWSKNKDSYTPNGTLYVIDGGVLDGLAAAAPYSGAYTGKYIFKSKEGAKCSVSENQIKCSGSSLLDRNTVQAFDIDPETGGAGEKTSKLIGGVFNRVDSPLNIN